MTQDDVIRLAKEAGLVEISLNGYEIWYPENMESYTKLVAKEIRFQAADDAWIELVKHGIEWELRKAVTDAIHARDEE